MSEGNQIEARIAMPGALQDKTRCGPNRLLTLDGLTQWITKQGLDEYTTKGLIDMASRYPTNALGSFRKNFTLMIARVRQKRREEQKGTEAV